MSSPPHEPITRRELSDEVFDRLKAMIVGSEIGAGQSLPSERELMVRFGVGRPAVREAMPGWLQEYHSHLLIWEGQGARTLAEHQEIIARIEARDPDGAERAMTGHLERSNHLCVHGDGCAG